MSNTEFTQVYKTPDGTVFESKAEAQTHIRRPKILAALLPVVDGNAEIANFLIDNREGVETALEAGTIKRVTKSDTAKLTKALDAVVALNDNKLNFITENRDAILESFRWPSVKRMDDAQKETAAVASLTVLCEGNGELATYVYSKREGVVTAYNAGVEKRQVNPAAAEALAKYHAERKAKKAAAEADAPAAEAATAE
jgi:hypothetical protein